MRLKTLNSLISTFIALFVISLSQTAYAEPLQQMPKWELKTETGELIRSDDLLGKPLVLHFWATWCPYCKKLLPGLQRLHTLYQDQGLQTYAISFNEDDDARPQAVLGSRGITFRTLVNGDYVARKLFKVDGTPTTMFINADGSVLAVTRSSNPKDPLLEEAVKKLLSNANVEQEDSTKVEKQDITD